MSFANAWKILRNWFLTLPRDLLNFIWNLPEWAQERAWTQYEHLTLYNIFVYAINQVHLCERKESFVKIHALTSYLKS